MTRKPARGGFTIIEILVVIAVIGILAGVALKAVNPAKRLKQARDSQRKTDITEISNALVNYAQSMDGYPAERTCDTSRGAGADQGGGLCPPSSGTTWANGPQVSWLNQELTKTQLKFLPLDPVNNSTYYYKYEPAPASGSNCSTTGSLCFRYWIGVRLEDVSDPSKTGKMVFRCSDDNSLAAKAGCKVVEFPSATGGSSFDNVSTVR